MGPATYLPLLLPEEKGLSTKRTTTVDYTLVYTPPQTGIDAV
jgi:hypothetical protein